MSGELIIYGAAYGREDVTGKVRELRKDDKISLTANNETFGDSWKGETKSFVVVYKYDSPHCTVEVAIIKENQQLTISPPPNLTRQRKDRRTATSLEQIGGITNREFLTASSPRSLTILGAAFGLENVTYKAQSLVTPQGEFNQRASDGVWGDGWKGQKKTLVAVYTYDEIYMVNVVTEDETMQFILSPALSIMGAAYGLEDVTDKALELMRNYSFNVLADNADFGDGWKGEKKTLIIVYQYGEQTPNVGIVIEGSWMFWIYSPRPRYVGSTCPNTLTILGAAYGPKDVTPTVQGHVKENSLNVTANNDTFGPDPWKGKKKSLVVVYRFGRNLPQTKVVEENAQLTIAQKIFRNYAGIISTNDLLDDGEIFLLSGLNNKYIECGPKGKLVAASDSTHLGVQFKVHKYTKDGGMKLEANEGKFVIVGDDKCLYVNGNKDNATKFAISISFSGGIRLSVISGMYIRIDPFDNSLKAESVDNFGASTAFEISLIKNETGTEELLALEKISDCDLAWASFIWKLTGGFFIAIGLGPFLLTGKVNTGVLSLIKFSPRAWAAVQKLVRVIVTGAKNNIKLAVTGSLGVISVLYHEGLLWTIFKMMLKIGAWYALGWALAKVIEIVFIPEAEAAELLASFTIWGIQLVLAALDIGQVCN